MNDLFSEIAWLAYHNTTISIDRDICSKCEYINNLHKNGCEMSPHGGVIETGTVPKCCPFLLEHFCKSEKESENFDLNWDVDKKEIVDWDI